MPRPSCPRSPPSPSSSGRTRLRHRLPCIDDLPDTVEAWGRSQDIPVGGWYGLRKGCAVGSGARCLRCWRHTA
ncbi:MAG TPA: hypothetical protein VHW64_00795 [Nocardioides sp.]|uniref:DUF6855 family protein n=1 Tax=Nocardioides sp. TaxID=35761 RepID=UPI002E3674F5|nr:hypothetical protein [Nocardioides sp.]HEX3929211.1 hypothetical protein [Nocardioides sp.]